MGSLGENPVSLDRLDLTEVPKNLQQSSSDVIPVSMVSSTDNSKDLKNTTPKSANDQTQQFEARKLPQWIAATSAQIGGFALGAMWFWTATGLPDLEKSGELGEITNTDKAWINSIVQLGGLIATPFTGYCVFRFGRRSTMLWSNIPFAGGCILIGVAQSKWLIYLGRFIIGVCSGIYGQIAPVFVSEACQPQIRGTLGCMFEIMICLGTLFIYIVGAYFSWRNQIFICAAIPVIGFIALWFVPESPYFFMERNRDKEAGEALRRLRGASSVDQVAQELQEICTCVRRESGSTTEGGWRVLRDPSIRKPIILSMGLMTFLNGSFIYVILGAAVEIFQSAGVEDEYLYTIIIGVTQLVATVIPTLITDKVGRKMLFMISLGLLTLSLSALGTYFHYYDKGEDSGETKWAWVPLGSLMLYMFATSIGIVPLSWLVMGEITPPRAKGLAITISTVWSRIVAFGVFYIFWDMLTILGNDGTYWTIAGIAVLAAVFIATCIPETKGKTLDEIQLLFIRGTPETSQL